MSRTSGSGSRSEASEESVEEGLNLSEGDAWATEHIASIAADLASLELTSLNVRVSYLSSKRELNRNDVVQVASEIYDESLHLRIYLSMIRASSEDGKVSMDLPVAQENLGRLAGTSEKLFILDILCKGAYLEALRYLASNLGIEAIRVKLEKISEDEARHVARAEERFANSSSDLSKELLLSGAEISRPIMRISAMFRNEPKKYNLIVLLGGGESEELRERGEFLLREMEDVVRSAQLRRVRRLGLDLTVANRLIALYGSEVEAWGC